MFSVCLVPSVPGVVQLSGQKEDSLLADVGSWTELRFAVFLQGYVPGVVFIFLRLICVVVVLLQPLQEVTFIGHRGLQRGHKEDEVKWIKNCEVKKNLTRIQRFDGINPSAVLTELYKRPSSLMARYRPASVPWMTTTPLSTDLSFKTAERRQTLNYCSNHQLD